MFSYILKTTCEIQNKIEFKSASIFNTVKTPSVAGPERPVWNTLLTYVSLPFTLVPFRKGHLNMLRIPFKEIPSYVYESTSVCVGAWVRAVRVHAPRAPPPLSPGGGVFVGALPVADALQADWPPNRIICCGLTPHWDDISFKVERASTHTLATT